MLQPIKLSSKRSDLCELFANHGSKSVPYFKYITQNFKTLQASDVGDIAYFLCVLHGSYPGVVDYTSDKVANEDTHTWLVNAMNGFSAERSFLTKLTVAAGPITGVGQYDQSEVTVHNQRKALQILSQSDRGGCAIGASIAVILDWHSIRPVLDSIALKLGIKPQSLLLPSIEKTQELYDFLISSALIKRATNFGIDQILSQHRGLWELLEARHNTRESNSRL